MSNKSEFVAWLAEQKKEHEGYLKRWHAKFMENPSYNFAQSEGAFEMASTLDVLTEVHEALKDKTTLDKVQEMLTHRVLNTVELVASTSTSVTGTLMRRYSIASYAYVLRKLKDFNR